MHWVVEAKPSRALEIPCKIWNGTLTTHLRHRRCLTWLGNVIYTDIRSTRSNSVTRPLPQTPNPHISSAVLLGLPFLALSHNSLLSPHPSHPEPTPLSTLPTQKYFPPFPPSNIFLHPSTVSTTFFLATLTSLSLLNFLSLFSSLVSLFVVPSSTSSTGTNISSTPRRSPVRSSWKHPVTNARVASRPAKKWYDPPGP